MKQYDLDDRGIWTEPETAEDARHPEILLAIEGAIEWQDDRPRLDWDEVWDRAEGYHLSDGTRLSLPGDLDSPVYRVLRAHGRKFRNALS